MKSKKHIVFVSISSDLYGSSKVLLSLVLQLQKSASPYQPIVCMPYEAGPLKDLLISEGIQIIEMPVVKLTRSMLKSFAFISLLKSYFKAKKIYKKETRGLEVACIQSNTLATLFGALYGVFHKTTHVVHVHEIIDRPKIAQTFFIYYLRFFSDRIVYNSLATEQFYNTRCPALEKKAITIFNGVNKPGHPLSEKERQKKRAELFQAGEDSLLIGLVGRINRLKGHLVLAQAFQKVSEQFPQSKLCFIGSPPPQQEHFETNLKNEISSLGLEDRTIFVDFQEDIFPVLECLDVVAVPSTEPESFGLIVVEAMLAKRVVVASRIGGISTLLEHHKTGFLVAPGNPDELSRTLQEVLQNKTLKDAVTEQAYETAKKEFSVETMYGKFADFYSKIL